MRLRGHTCSYCIAIDEAHHSRHQEIVQQFHKVYESCGEHEWSVIPADEEERGRVGENRAGEKADRSETVPDATPTSKRERKDAKRLARATSRARVVTQEEIFKLDTVIHASDSTAMHSNEGPKNPEEIEEIENHLRYNANVYNNNSSRQWVKQLTNIADANVNFDVEVNRILSSLHISELLQRNTKNKGLQGRELKVFQALVNELKKMIVEDIVLARKDNLETRMRRAAFLRYTNKTAYGILEERYSTKSWKTGDKLESNTSNGSICFGPRNDPDAVDG